MKFNHNKIKQAMAERDIHTLHGLHFAMIRANYNISAPGLRNWMSGACAPKSSNLAMLASFFGKDINYFFEETKNEL